MKELFNGNYTDCFLANRNDNNQIDKIRDLTISEVQDIIEANKEIHNLNYYSRRLTEVYLNYYDLADKISAYSAQIEEMDVADSDTDLMEKIYIDINRTFTNFISSLVNFVDDIEEKRYKRNGTNYDLFHATTSDLYDKYLSYRLFYKLRNYALHYNFPIDIFRKTFVENKATGNYDSILQIYFDRDKILEGNFIKGPFKKELLRYNHEFEIKHTINSILKPIQKIADVFFQIEKEQFEKHAKKILTYAAEGTDRVSVGKYHETLPKIDALELPIKIIKNLRGKISQIH